MKRNRRFIILALSGIVFFIPVFTFINYVYNLSVEDHLEHEFILQKSLYKSQSINKLPASKFVVNLQDKSENIFNENVLSALHKKLKKSTQLKISKKLKTNVDFSYPAKLDKYWRILTFIKLQKDDDSLKSEYIVTLSVSKDLSELEYNRTISYYMLAVVLIILLTLLNKTMRYTKELKEERDNISQLLKETRLYFENAMIGFLVVDKNRNIINVNPLFCEIFGYEKHELIGKSALILHLNEESYKRWGELVFSKAQKRKLVSIRYRVKKKDGTKFWVDISGAPTDKTRQLVGGGVVWTAKDITEQVKYDNTIKNLNKTLEHSLEYLQIFLDAKPVQIFVKDKNNVYIECNNAYLETTKMKKREVINYKIKDILPEHIANIHSKKDLELLNKDSIHYKEIYNFKDNKTIIYEFFKTVLKKNGKYNGYICAMVDVTRHEEQEAYLEKRVEDEIHKNSLQEKVHEEERLRDVKFSAIGQLSAGITHEINTPLTYIKGNFEMMQMDIQDLPSSELREQLVNDSKHIEDGLSRISTIVDSMREMAQHTKESKEVVNIYSTLITSLIMAHNRSKHICKIHLNSKEFNINCDKQEYIHLSNIHKQRIEQVWVVIINNALDELQKVEHFEDRELYINCYDNGDHIITKFKDNAGGIDDDIVDSIFEPFTSSKPQGGMGVGLSIVKKILNEQNGTIKAYNDMQGAIFEITLPKHNL